MICSSVHNLVRKGCLEIKIKTSLLHRTIKIMEPHLNWWLCPGLTRCISRFHNQNSYIITSFHELFENCRLSNALNDLHLVFKQCTYVRYPCKDKIKNYCFRIESKWLDYEDIFWTVWMACKYQIMNKSHKVK